MAQEIKGKSQEPKNNTPLLIIGGVFVLVLIGGWYLYSKSKPPVDPGKPTPGQLL
ncbi:MAG: LPXTG cell wall anchor domain-containing protein [Pyrinomonadaceae bacterium]